MTPTRRFDLLKLIRRSKAPRKLRSKRRKGTAVVEVAVCLPILILLVMSMIEASNMIFLKQALTHAGYEAARVAAYRGTKNSEPTTLANEILNSRNIASAEITVTPSDIESLSRGNDIVVSVSALSDANSLVPFTQFGGQTLSVSMTSVKN